MDSRTSKQATNETIHLILSPEPRLFNNPCCNSHCSGINNHFNLSTMKLWKQIAAFFVMIWSYAKETLQKQWYDFSDTMRYSRESKRMEKAVKKARLMANAHRRRYYVFIYKGKPVAVNMSEIKLLARAGFIRGNTFADRFREAVFIADCDNKIIKDYIRNTKTK